MRTIDLSPFYRSSVGFDRIFDLLENAARLHAGDSWPPYDIVKTGENSYRITMAVAGFTQDELELTQEQNVFVVNGSKAEDDGVEYLHRGIGHAFSRRFELADYVKVVGARIENGILTIELVREVPEELQPRRIEIVAGAAQQTFAPPQSVSEKKKAA